MHESPVFIRSLFSSLFTLVYHKQCVPNCVWNGRCGVCKPETTSERRRSISPAPVESESKPPPKRHESRRDENEESKGLKRLPFRSTRTAVPREMIDDESSKPSPKKRRVQSKQKTESQGKIGASKGSELVFDRINGEKAMQLLNQLLKDLYEDGMKEEVPILVNIKNCLRSVIAVSEGFLFHSSGFLRFRSPSDASSVSLSCY